jgi:hypothetical protein
MEDLIILIFSLNLSIVLFCASIVFLFLSSSAGNKLKQVQISLYSISANFWGSKFYQNKSKKLDTKKTKYNTIVNLVFNNIPLQGLTS